MAAESEQALAAIQQVVAEAEAAALAYWAEIEAARTNEDEPLCVTLARIEMSGGG